MATLTGLLEKLSEKEAAISTIDLATELKSTRQTTLKQLTRIKDKDLVDGNSEEGWVITDAGKNALAQGPIHPSMLEEEVTPRQQFEAIGRRIGIKEDRIVLTTDIVWSGDYNDVKWVWEALGQADIANDLRSVWVNSWRAKLHKGIPPELEVELTRVSKVGTEGGKDVVPSRGREFIIMDDEPVRVGENLGDYSLQDAKDILAIRALRSRFATAQAGVGQGGGPGAGGAAEKVSDILTALEPYINKGSDFDMLKEVLGDKLALHRQEILSHMPQPGQPTQPQSFIGQIGEFIALMSTLKEAGPTLRSALGIPEPSGNPSTTPFPVQVKGPDGSPIVMDLGQVINWRKFQSDERREDERHGALIGMAQTVRENIPDGIQAILRTVAEVKGGTGAKATPQEKKQVFQCGDCGAQFSIPDVPFETVKCPNPECGREYLKEELVG